MPQYTIARPYNILYCNDAMAIYTKTASLTIHTTLLLLSSWSILNLCDTFTCCYILVTYLWRHKGCSRIGKPQSEEPSTQCIYLVLIHKKYVWRYVCIIFMIIYVNLACSISNSGFKHQIDFIQERRTLHSINVWHYLPSSHSQKFVWRYVFFIFFCACIIFVLQTELRIKTVD